MNTDSDDDDAQDSQKKPDQQNDTLSEDLWGNVCNGQAVGIPNEAAISREKALTAREEASHSRDEAADQRDGAAHIREHEVHLREGAALSRENLIQEAEAMQAALENQIGNLRQANEQLVIATVKTQEMAEELEKAKNQMGHIAHHDFLTGLPNRILLKERLIQAIALARRHGTKLAVLFIDLDRFKTINDSQGHAIGDTLLQLVAQRLTAAIRISDTISRQGGDEFVALLSEVADEKAVSGFADKISKAVTAPYTIAEQDFHIGVTIGISMYPDDGKDAETLIQHADVAMYHAKNGGGNRYHFFRREMNDRVVERQRIESDLYRALEQQEFTLYYQAQMDLQTGSIIGVEALIRWCHPVRGLVLPAVFVPVAEECGAIVPIGRWVLREACRQMQAWLDAGMPLHVVTVNISAVEFGRDDFFENVRTVLRDTALAPHHLELELTESMLMKNGESAMAMLQALKSIGVRIAIDDFGTGYSSLSYLKKFPVDTLKIDQSFVAGIGSNGGDDILVDAVIGLGKNFRHRVVAEGIETHEQLAFLSNHHCADGQGYFLSPPIIAENFSALLKSGVSRNLFPQSPAAGITRFS